MKGPEPIAARVRELLAYDQETGDFVWIKGQRAGRKAGTVSLGYTKIIIDGRSCLAHRLVWLYVHGVCAPGHLDHINGRRSDNRLVNLRVASYEVNQQNRRGANRNSITGLLGVDLRPSGRFGARIYVAGRHIFIGSFSSAQEAHEAYITAKRQLHIGGTL